MHFDNGLGESPARFDSPRTPEEAVVGLLISAGRRMRTRQPGDELEPSCFPLARHLMHRGSVRVSDLAALTELDASTVSRHVKMLEQRGIVERQPDPEDGRASLVRLSDAGHAAIEGAFSRRFDRIKAALEPWSQPDRDALQRLLSRLAADLREADQHEQREQHAQHSNDHAAQLTETGSSR